MSTISCVRLVSLKDPIVVSDGTANPVTGVTAFRTAARDYDDNKIEQVAEPLVGAHVAYLFGGLEFVLVGSKWTQLARQAHVAVRKDNILASQLVPV